jgi:hypothetical protein
MKSQNLASHVRDIPTNILQSDLTDESDKDGPTTAEIRERAFEIHIERGGIHGCDLDDWLRAEHELKAKYNKNRDPGTKKK